MYCSNCGNTINNKLNYCNICGGKLIADADDSYRPILIILIVSLSIISIVGLGSLIGLLAMLLERGVREPTIILLSIFFLISLFGIIFTLGRQISKLIDVKILKNTKNTEAYLPPQLTAPTTGQLEEPKQQPFSVVDNTTKTLNEVYIKRS